MTDDKLKADKLRLAQCEREILALQDSKFNVRGFTLQVPFEAHLLSAALLVEIVSVGIDAAIALREKETEELRGRISNGTA